MQKNELINFLIYSVEAKYKKLTTVQRHYLFYTLNKAELCRITRNNIDICTTLLANDIADKDKMYAYAMANGLYEVDVKSHLFDNLLDDTDLTSVVIKQENNEPVVSNDQQTNPTNTSMNIARMNIATVFSIDTLPRMVKELNPKVLIETNYIALDRLYQDTSLPDTTRYRWILHSDANLNGSPAIFVKTPLTNIIGMKMMPFKLPFTLNQATYGSFKFPTKLTILVEELKAYSYKSAEDNRRYHFKFDMKKNTSSAGNIYYTVEHEGENDAIFYFPSPITHLDTITLSFGILNNLLVLDPVQLIATISSISSGSNVGARLVFTTQHNLLHDKIVVTGFTTADPIADTIAIDQMNNPEGLFIISTSLSNEVTVDADIHNTAAILNNPYTVSVDTRRFIIPMEFYTRGF